MAEGSSKSILFEVFHANINDEKTPYKAIVATSFVLFNVNAFLILPKIAPKSARNTPEQLWKWRNIANSLIHSILSGFGALWNLLGTPELTSEIMTAYSVFSYSTVSFSVGYFVYDFIDMASHHRRTSTYELLVHHTLVVICFCFALVTKFYQGYALVSLLIEINSIFLHIRQLFIIQGWKKVNLCGWRKTFYKLNSYFNIGTFIVFRLMTLVWMMYWLTLNFSGLNVGKPTVLYTVMGQISSWCYFLLEITSEDLCNVFIIFFIFLAFALMFFLIHSLKLLKKILIADGYMSKKNDSKTSLQEFQTSASEK